MWKTFLTEKSIFSLFPGEVLNNFPVEDYVRKVRESETLLQEGLPFSDLCIPLNTTLQLAIGKKYGKSNSLGSVQPGRSGNMYAFIRSLPSQYSLVAESDGEVLIIPRSLVENWFSKYPEVKSYLFKMSESPVFRSLASDLRSIGVSQNFVHHFLHNLESVQLTPHNYLTHPETKVSAASFLVEGKFLLKQNLATQKSWLMPLKAWVGWKEALNSFAAESSILTLSNSTCFQIKSETLQSLQKTYPEDFSLVNRWVQEGVFRIHEDEENEEEIEDVSELFSEAIEKPRWTWKYPWVKQNDEMDCGPACLAMISRYFEKDLSVQFWRSRLSTDQTGTSFYDLASTTERTGFIAHCLEVQDLHELDSFLFPFIALRKYHYVVVYKVNKKSVIVGDPGIGIREMPLAEFYDGFEKVGLFLKPNANFLDLETSPSPWKHYLQLFKGLESEMLLALGCAILSVLVSLAPPVISQIVLDEVLSQKNQDLLWILLAVAFGVTLLGSFVAWAESYYFIYIMGKFNFRANSVFLQKMLSLPYQFFATRHVGDFTHRLAEMSHLRQFVTGTLFGVLLNIVTTSIYGVSLFLISPKAALAVVLMAPLILFVPMLTSKYLSRIYGEIFTKSSEQFSFMTDVVKGVSAIKSLGAEMTIRFRFESKLIGLIKSQNKFAMTSNHVETFTTGYNQMAQFAIMALTVYLGIKGELSAGKVISFSLIAAKVFDPLLSLSKQWDQFIEMKSVLSRLNDIFLSPSDHVQNSNTPLSLKSKLFSGEIEFRDVWFRYGGEATEWVLKGVSFKIEPGQKVAVVGPSGSGKSTLAYLLTRMYEPNKGQILIDGRDYREYDLNWLRSQVGHLHQESSLFEGTLAENIALKSLEIEETELRAAANRAAILSYIENKPAGFRHYVPHGGLGFSGGEKQKIALARLFYHRPSVAVLDEATSALDGIAESAILSNLKSEMKSCTVLNIAHRYSTVLSSDFALVLMDGKVAGFGSLEYLKMTNPVFQKLFNLAGIEENLKKGSAA